MGQGDFEAGGAKFGSTDPATHERAVGTGDAPYDRIVFGDAEDHRVYFGPFTSKSYDGGGIDVDLYMRSDDEETTNNMHLGVAIGRGHAGQDLDDLDFGTEETDTFTPAGTGGGVKECSLTVGASDDDALAAGELWWLRVRRVADPGGDDSGGDDTLSGPASLLAGHYEYTDS